MRGKIIRRMPPQPKPHYCLGMPGGVTRFLRGIGIGSLWVCNCGLVWEYALNDDHDGPLSYYDTILDWRPVSSA